LGKSGEIVSKLDGLTQRSTPGAVGDTTEKASLSLFTEQKCGPCGQWDPLKVSEKKRHMVIQQLHTSVCN